MNRSTRNKNSYKCIYNNNIHNFNMQNSLPSRWGLLCVPWHLGKHVCSLHILHVYVHTKIDSWSHIIADWTMIVPCRVWIYRHQAPNWNTNKFHREWRISFERTFIPMWKCCHSSNRCLTSKEYELCRTSRLSMELKEFKVEEDVVYVLRPMPNSSTLLSFFDWFQFNLFIF